MISGVVGFNTKRALNPQEFSGFSSSLSLAPLISEFLTAIAARFKVSPLALLIRWRELDLVNEVGFQTLRQEYELELSRIPKKTAPSGGSFFTTAPVRSGKRLTRAVLGSTFEGETSFTDAFKLLGSKKTDSLRELALRMGGPVAMYLVDSNVLITAKNGYYSFAICPGFWDWILSAHAAGRLSSNKHVYREPKMAIPICASEPASE